MREGWVAPKSKIFGTLASLERHLRRLAATEDVNGRALAPARWCVQERPVGAWSELEGMSNGLAPAARRAAEVRALPERVEVERYDPLPECRRLVLEALAREPELTLNGLRQMVPMRHDMVRRAAMSLVDDGQVVVADGPRRSLLFRAAAVEGAA